MLSKQVKIKKSWKENKMKCRHKLIKQILN